VAVKVRHPGVSTMMQRDFVLMQRAAALSAKLPVLRDLNLQESVRQFGAPLREQLDLSSEVCGNGCTAPSFRIRCDGQLFCLVGTFGGRFVDHGTPEVLSVHAVPLMWQRNSG